MTRRNPMNSRYQEEGSMPKGKTRKSAAAAKPKSPAAGSVTMQGKKPMTKQQKREERAKKQQEESKYLKPPVKAYRDARRLWIGLLAMAFIMVFASAPLQSVSRPLSFVAMAAAFAFMLAAVIVDVRKVRKIREAYRYEMTHKAKGMRAAEKSENAAKRQNQKQAASKEEDLPENQEGKQAGGFFSGIKNKAFGKSKDSADAENSGSSQAS